MGAVQTIFPEILFHIWVDFLWAYKWFRGSSPGKIYKLKKGAILWVFSHKFSPELSMQKLNTVL